MLCEDDLTVIRIDGDLDYAGISEMGETLLAIVSESPRPVVLDCEDLGFLDSSGLRLVVEAANATTAGQLSLRSVPPQMRSLLRICGLGDVIAFEAAN